MTTTDILADVAEALFAMDKLLKRTKEVQAAYTRLALTENDGPDTPMNRAACMASGASVSVEIKLLEAMRAIAVFNSALQGLEGPVPAGERGQLARWG